MIIFKASQGLENFYIKFQDFPYFSRTCTNPVETNRHEILPSFYFSYFTCCKCYQLQFNVQTPKFPLRMFLGLTPPRTWN